MEIELKKKSKVNKTLLLTLPVFLVLALGISYAFFTYTKTSDKSSQLITGDIYMHYNESNELTIENAIPSTTYDENKYFEFTINGKNTYTEEDIWYEIILSHGEKHATRTERIRDNLLKFTLVEIKDGNEKVVVNGKSYEDLTNQRIWVNTIPKTTNSEINITYRLYMWISDEILVGVGENIDYSMDTWNNLLYGSVRVSVNGDFEEKEVPLTASETIKKAIDDKIISNSSCKTYVEEDGIIYLSGTKECVDFNYVWYSGKLWRITAIYPDGTMKMITDGSMTSINWGEKSTVSDTDLTSAYPTSYIREWLNQEFLPTLYNYENIIDVDARWYSITDSASTPTKPIGDYTLTDPVGLLNAYEYYMSYKNASTSTNYLNIGYNWWLITPYSSSNVVRKVDNDGSLSSYNPANISYVVRPTVNLISTIEFNGGLGTINAPYRVKGDIVEAELNATLLNTRYSGEYVELEDDENGRLFRIVDKELVGEKLTTKLVLNDYIKESDTILKKSFSVVSGDELWSEVYKSDKTYWRGYLNTTWLTTLDTNMLEKGIYYLGYHSTGSYKTTVCSVVSRDISINGCIENGTIVSNIISSDYVGLPREGEMFASQPSYYTSSTASRMWLITPGDSRNVRCILDGYLQTCYPNPYAARPTINLTSAIIIKSGSGTEQDPFVVGLPS